MESMALPSVVTVKIERLLVPSVEEPGRCAATDEVTVPVEVAAPA